MLLKSINLKSFLLLFFIGFSLFGVTAMPPDGEEDEDSNGPFNNPAIKAKGDRDDCIYFHEGPYNFTVTLENIQLDFPCDLHVGIKSPNGEIEFIKLEPNMFSTNYSNLSTANNWNFGPQYYIANISGGEISYEEYSEYDCIMSRDDSPDFKLIPFELNFYCRNEIGRFLEVDYCQDYMEFQSFLGSWYGPDDCDLTSTVYKKFCCDLNKISGRSAETDEFNNNKLEISSSNKSILIKGHTILNPLEIFVSNLSGQQMDFVLTDNEQELILNLETSISGVYFVSYLRNGSLVTKKVFLH